MYILECADGSYYTGSTKDLERRLWEHQNGLGANHTAKRLPVKLVFCEECDRIDDAFYREKQVQGWSRKKKEALMASDYNQIHLLAVCKNETHCRNVGFDSAQPTGTVTVQTRDNLARSLSGVEGNNTDARNKGMVG
jgi:putative endonuclease